MSKENATAFVQKVFDDDELRQRTGAMKPEELIPFAKEAGFDFTLEELQEVKKEDIELSPEELEAAAGGLNKVFDAMDNSRRSLDELPEQMKHCNEDLNGPFHNWIVIGHEERPILGGLLSWAGDWSDGYDILKCSLCGVETKQKV